MELVDKCLDDTVTSILLQTNNQVPIYAILNSEQNLEAEEGLAVGTDGKLKKIPACHVDTFYLSVNASGNRYARILVGDVPRLQDPDSSHYTSHPEAVKKVENDAGYMLRRLLKSDRKIFFTSRLMNLKRETVTTELVDKLCPGDDLKKSIALQYDFLNQ
ncbi:Uncharacterised protein [uncultured archaeon]|nr:Uncharacterised protein [uncultured archaeon]